MTQPPTQLPTQLPASQTYPLDAWKLLNARLTPERRQKMLTVAGARSKYLRLVLQDVHNAHNISACLRSAEAFGVLQAEVVNVLPKRFKRSPVARGVDQWLRIRPHTDIPSCAAALKAEGFVIAAGMPGQNARPLKELPLDRPLAVLFGNEHAGVASQWLDHADYTFTIPMSGIVESLNISVCAAIAMHELSSRARLEVPAAAYYLDSDEQQALLCEWICRHFRSWEGEYAFARQQQSGV